MWASSGVASRFYIATYVILVDSESLSSEGN